MRGATRSRAGPQYGSFRFDGEALMVADPRIVLFQNLRVSEIRFPSVQASAAVEWEQITRRLLPTSALVVSLASSHDDLRALMVASPFR